VTDVLGLFLVGVALGTQEIGEKDHLDDDKKDEQLDAYDEPQRLAHGHTAESIVVEMENARPEALIILAVVGHRPKY
jgi:hypothetical protein